MPFIGGGHLVYIILFLVIVLIIFGPGKLPEIGAGAGKAIREFKKASSEVREHMTNATSEGSTASTPAPAPAAPQPPASASPVGSVPAQAPPMPEEARPPV